MSGPAGRQTRWEAWPTARVASGWGGLWGRVQRAKRACEEQQYAPSCVHRLDGWAQCMQLCTVDAQNSQQRECPVLPATCTLVMMVPCQQTSTSVQAKTSTTAVVDQPIQPAAQEGCAHLGNDRHTLVVQAQPR